MKVYKIKKGESIFSTLINQKEHPLDAPCGGNGKCGKCRIKVIEGEIPVTKREMMLLSKEELEKGIRLACLHPVCEKECSFIQVGTLENYEVAGSEKKEFTTYGEKGYAIAVDIGTTTIVLELLDLEKGKIIEEKTFMNPQHIFGADVIARIDAANKQGTVVIQKVLIEKMEQEIKDWMTYDIKRMVVCGNPAMTHIFMGEDPASIGVAPYLCKVKEYREFSSKQLFEVECEFTVQVLPPISAYVGSDIVMGIYAVDQIHSNQTSILLDLGTNGEIALYDGKQLTLTSAACGPAFEGGNMSCGKGAVKGAICRAVYENRWQYQTIQNGMVEGICGSGIMDILKEARRLQWLDETGYLQKDVILHENAYITQKDVREFQMAKSAIASAFHCLCKVRNLKEDEIDVLYIAGGFGKHVHIENLIDLKIIPEQLRNKICVIGNSAIDGVCQFAFRQNIQNIIEICENAESLLLANNLDFTDEFMKNMMF